MCFDSNGTSEGTWYLVLCTLYNEVLISNAELRLKNKEVGICMLTPMELLKLLGTLYLPACRRQGTLYNEVLISNAELRSKNEEVGICMLTPMALLKLLGTLYFVHCTMKF